MSASDSSVRLPPAAVKAPLVFLVLLLLGCPLVGEESAKDNGWSADLLNQILKAEPPTQGAASPAAGEEMILHTYRLTHLRVGEAGKVQNVLAILGNLLPAGSSMNPDVPANSVHVLTTAGAHKAVWDYLSAVDVPEPTSAPVGGVVPDEVKAALKRLAEAGDRSDRLLKALGNLQTDLTSHFAEIDARQRRQTMKLVFGSAAFALVLVGTLGWMLRRRAPAPEPPSAALVLAPDQVATALTPVHDRMRTDMLGLLNEVAIKLQAQHNEQQKLVREQQQQLEDARNALADERRQFISEAGTMVVQAVERVDATTAKLARQQDKVAELVQELQDTVRELDETKDNLRTREVELEQERSKIAALSILLEEGGVLPPSVDQNGHAPELDACASNLNGATSHGLRAAPEMPCTSPDQAILTTSTLQIPLKTGPRPAARFTFLPPDLPET